MPRAVRTPAGWQLKANPKPNSAKSLISTRARYLVCMKTFCKPTRRGERQNVESVSAFALRSGVEELGVGLVTRRATRIWVGLLNLDWSASDPVVRYAHRPSWF